MLKKVILILLLVFGIIPAQTVYEVPIGSKNNLFEFELENFSGGELNGLVFLAAEFPEWVKFSQEAIRIKSIEGTQVARFSFEIKNGTETGLKGDLKFVIVCNNQSIAEKIISIETSLPKEYELMQNYPNPFNPSTQIEFLLPVEEKVTLKIFNMLGQEVATLLNEKLDAGLHRIDFDGSQLASGRYVYKLISKNKVLSKKMILMK